MEKLLNIFFIPECVFCRTAGSFFCAKCMSSCTQIKPVIFGTKKFPARFLFAYEYERFIRECIRNAKYRNKHFAALKVLTKSVVADFKPPILKYLASQKSLIVPIPVSSAKLRKRGFNQAELIAQIFAKQLTIPLKSSLLKRVKDTTSQYTNTRSQRFANMKGAFEAGTVKNAVDTKIILIDDVCTTGATFLEAAKAFYKIGVKDVLCVALARKSLTKG